MIWWTNLTVVRTPPSFLVAYIDTAHYFLLNHREAQRDQMCLIDDEVSHWQWDNMKVMRVLSLQTDWLSHRIQIPFPPFGDRTHQRRYLAISINHLSLHSLICEWDSLQLLRVELRGMSLANYHWRERIDKSTLQGSFECSMNGRDVSMSIKHILMEICQCSPRYLFVSSSYKCYLLHTHLTPNLVHPLSKWKVHKTLPYLHAFVLTYELKWALALRFVRLSANNKELFRPSTLQVLIIIGDFIVPIHSILY